MNTRSLSALAILSIAVALSSCSKDATVTGLDPNSSSWNALQVKVIVPTCTGCHTAGNQYALQSGLVLTSDVAFANLVNVIAQNVNANADGLMRIKPGLPDSSLLYLKLHGLPAAKNYGNPMPLGYKPLTVGQLEFIKEWIAAGAPHDGVVADAKLLDDTTASPDPTFTALPAPGLGQGLQVHIDPFSVQPQFEREIFVYKQLGNANDIYVNRIETRMRTNSHHFIMYTLDPNTPANIIPPYNVIRDLRNPNGVENTSVTSIMEYHQFLGGSTVPNFDYHFPAGTALLVPANTSLDLNTHYINYTNAPLTGEVYANLYTTDQIPQHVANTLLIGETNLNLPPHQQTVVRSTYPNYQGQAISFFMLTSHMHARGVKFKIIFAGLPGNPLNGQVIYESDDWEHPAITNFDTPLVLQNGEAITTEVTYNNTTDQTIHFGFTSKDEMDIVIGYYYPN